MTYFDFNSASEQTSFDLIPKGTLVRVRMTIRPGGFDDASQGWTGGYATGFSAWGGIFFLNGRWYAVGGGKDLHPHLLAVGERTVCMAKADDWLNDHESADSAYKTRRWLNEPPTDRQLRYIPEQMRANFGMTRYQASALLAFQFNKSSIQRLVVAANDSHREAA